MASSGRAEGIHATGGGCGLTPVVWPNHMAEVIDHLTNVGGHGVAETARRWLANLGFGFVQVVDRLVDPLSGAVAAENRQR